MPRGRRGPTARQGRRLHSARGTADVLTLRLRGDLAVELARRLRAELAASLGGEPGRDERRQHGADSRGRARATPRVVRRESGAIVHQLLAAVDDVFWLLQVPDLRCVYVSPAYERVWGRSVNAVYEDPAAWMNAIHPEDRQHVATALETCVREGQHHVEYRIVRSDGTVRWIRDRGFRMAPTLDGARLAGIATDVTDERQARDLVAEASRRKDEFLAMLGHELRNPLGAVRSALATAQLDATKRDRALDIACRQTEQLTRIVDDLLDVARITQGRIHLRPERLALADVVRRVVEGAHPKIEERYQQLHVALPEESVDVLADPTRLEQIVENLLGNASKYTPPGGRIDVVMARDADDVVVHVRDTGIRIAHDMLGRVFDLFAQVDPSLDRGGGGLGIGLTIVKRLVELHGGNIAAHSDGPGRGADFVVRLPALRTTERAPAPEPRRRRSRDGQTGAIRVLLVEDNRDAAESLGMFLGVAGHKVDVAHNGPEALSAARRCRPDVALVDIGLPGMDGYEVARRLRELPGMTTTALVALTGYGRDEDRHRARAAGFDDHLVKPVDPEALHRMLADHVLPRTAARRA